MRASKIYITVLYISLSVYCVSKFITEIQLSAYKVEKELPAEGMFLGGSLLFAAPSVS